MGLPRAPVMMMMMAVMKMMMRMMARKENCGLRQSPTLTVIHLFIDNNINNHINHIITRFNKAFYYKFLLFLYNT